MENYKIIKIKNKKKIMETKIKMKKQMKNKKNQKKSKKKKKKNLKNY